MCQGLLVGPFKIFGILVRLKKASGCEKASGFQQNQLLAYWWDFMWLLQQKDNCGVGHSDGSKPKFKHVLGK